MRYLPLLLLLSGCMPEGDTTALPHQHLAVILIWNQTYGETKPAPVVYWRRDRCNEPNGIYGTLPNCTFDYMGERVDGLETTGDQWVEVGAPSDDRTFSHTALAHELLHASIGDSDHKSPRWATDIDASNAALAAYGL